ncbi:MAG: phosphonate ABC transporter ATP-binding protein [Chloroflexi bacterium]|nr:phosphonate ABC transporter ATP-binding protein [Chloroflexota bacterium]
MLRTEDLRKRFPDGTEALCGVSLVLRAGEMACVLGSSGSGKSTLMRCVAGLIEPTHGAVWINGRPMTSAGERERRRLRGHMGFIFQQFNLVGRLSVMTNVLIGRLGRVSPAWAILHQFGRSDRACAYRALESVGLAEKARQRADTLSGGQQQRVAIARVLAQEPFLVLADEPVSSLDPRLADSVLGHLLRINREDGVTTLLNLHTVELARRYADRIIGLGQGQVVFDGPVHALDHDALELIYGPAGETGSADEDEEGARAGTAREVVAV